MNSNAKEGLVRFIMSTNDAEKHIVHHVAFRMDHIEIRTALPTQKYRNAFYKQIPWDFRMIQMTDKEIELHRIQMNLASRRALTDVWSKMSNMHKTKFLGKLSEDVLREIRHSYKLKKRTNGMERMEKKLLKEVKAENKRLEKEWLKRRLAEQQKSAKKV